MLGLWRALLVSQCPSHKVEHIGEHTLVAVSGERHAPGIQYSDTFQGPEFSNVSCDHFFDIVCDMDTADVDCSVLPHEAPYTAHIVSVVAVLLAPIHMVSVVLLARSPR